MKFLASLVLALGTTSVLLAQVTPPARVNYQGALRNNLGVPENGDRDVILHLYDAAAAGTEIANDRHTLDCSLDGGATTEEVTVSGGLFNVHLGGGCMDGVVDEMYDALELVFRDYDEVYLEVEVRVGAAGGAGAYETLSPRTRIVSAAFSLNSSHLQGKPATEFIDTTSNQSKSGQLTLSGGILGLGAATLSEGQVSTLTGGAASVADALHTHTLVSGAASAANAELLDGLDSGAFLRKNASDTFVGPGNLSFAAATQLLGDAGTAALPGIAFGGDVDTGIYHPANNMVSISAGGSDALVVANSILRFTSPVLGNMMYLAGSGLHIAEKLSIGCDEPAACFAEPGHAIYYEDPDDFIGIGNDVSLSGVLSVGSPGMPLSQTFSSIGVGGFKDEATVSDMGDLFVANELEVDGTLFGGTQILPAAGSAAVPGLGFNADSDTGLFSSAANTLSVTTGGTERMRVDSVGRMGLGSALRAGSVTTTAYNHLGAAGAPSSANVTGPEDAFVQDDVEVDGTLYLNGELRIDDNGPDASQHVYFYDGGSPTGQAFRWIESKSVFEVTDAFSAFGPFSAPCLPDRDPVTGIQYSQFGCGSDTPDSGAITTGTDLYIQDDLEVDGTSYLENITFEQTVDSARTLSNAFDIVFRKDTDNDSSAWFRFYTSDAVAGVIEQMRIEDGDEAAAKFDGAVTANGLDYAEAFKITDETLEAGDVVSLELSNPGHCVRSNQAMDRNILGVVSGNPAYISGMSFDAEDEADPEIARRREEARSSGDEATERQLSVELSHLVEKTHRPIALMGRLPVKVDGAHGAIRAGDRLTSSPTPGHAMVLSGPGPSLGIALEGWSAKNAGKILAFIQPGWFGSEDAASAGAAAPSAETQASAPDARGTQVLDGNLQIVLDKGADDRSRMSVFRDGATGLAAEIFRVDEDGNVYARGSFRPSSLDLAEYHPVSEPVETGDVLVADRQNPGLLRRGAAAADPAVVGIVSGEPGVLMGSGIARIASVDPERATRMEEARQRGDKAEEARLWSELESRFKTTHAALALSGTVPCKVDASFGAIAVGDLLVASSTPGHAMRSPDGAAGTIVGKALESLDSGTGSIRVLVMLR